MSRVFKKLLRNRLAIPFTPFYRHYPYSGGLAIDSADARGCVDTQLGFFYNRIPKAANSTIVTTLARLRFNQEIPSKQAKKIFLTPSLLYTDEVENFDRLFRFVIARNPFTRTLSAYLDKVERHAIRDGKKSTFKNFLYQLDAGKLHSDGHWVPQSDLLLIPVEQFDFIGRVESLQADLSKIKNRLLNTQSEEPVKSFLTNATKEQRFVGNASSKLGTYYDAECVQLVRKLYRIDFELFDYAQDLPV